MIQRQLRSYEVSVWSLQDDFISVLKSADIEHKGQVQEPELKLSVDGTQEFSFSIPMYLHDGEKLVENPAWYDYTNGVIVTNVRKIKVIINKATDDEEVFEFLITKITEKHDKNELYCDVECEGLAFQELGKIGYKISLKSDDFYDEDLKWFEAGADEATQPKATLQYWCNKFLEPYPTDAVFIDPHKWYYTIEMDWSSYTRRANDGTIKLRDSDKVYEDEYVSSWQPDDNDNILVPNNFEGYKEKERMVDLEESNKYNLTQDLAKVFEVYCKYIYEHDEHYRITGRKIVFYNSFIEEDKGPIDINYRYNTTSISRELDSTELITKMFVRPVDSTTNDSGLITIMNVDANKSKEDYLLNFDYLYKIGAIDEDLYNAVPIYEKKMHDCNVKLIEIENRLIDTNTKIPETEAKLTMAKNAVQLDQERITSSNDLLNNLIKKNGTEGSGVLSVTYDNPDTAVLMQEEEPNIYSIKISKEGVIPETVSIYKTINFSVTGPSRLTDKIDKKNYVYNRDEFNNIIKISNLYLEDNDKRVVYLTYDYKPQLHYENIKRTWAARLANDQKDVEKYEIELEILKAELKMLESEQKAWLFIKQKEIDYFEQIMGPALREGYWQPDDYTDYGDNYVETHNIAMRNLETNTSMRSSFVWDDNAFDEEQSLYYELGVNQTKTYYPCIDLSNSSTLAAIKNNLDKLSFLYYDYDAPTAAGSTERKPNTRRSIALGSEAKLAFVMTNNVVKPVLLLTGVEKMTDDAITYMLSNSSSPALGTLKTELDLDDEQNPIKIVEDLYVNSIYWITLDDNSKVVFPRVRFNSSSLKTSEDQLSVLFNNSLLTNYSDFYLLTRAETGVQDSGEEKIKYYLTIRPETFIAKLSNSGNSIKVKFTLSNADTSIYLDALQVLKDSSIPQVSYDLDVGLVQEQYIKTAYKMLNRIVHINDNELHFENVQGYISEVTLDLDAPLEDKIEIKNYKTKFEDLFSKIVASTEQMKKTEYASTIVSQAFSSDGAINAATLTTSLAKSKMNYSFNNGQLTMNESEGIWAVSDSGIVSLRSDGIFAASEQDPNGNWLWKSCILPQGINADLIVAGQLDTSKIRILSGDKMRFQWNSDGLFAYKENVIDNTAVVDGKQYVVMNEDGLFLRAEKGCFGQDDLGNDVPNKDVDRVAISWDGLTLYNYNGDKTLYMDPDTGNLKIQGNLYLNSSGFGERGGMYLGEEGFSISDIFKIYRNITSNKLDYFSIEDSSADKEFEEQEYIEEVDENSNYLFRLQREQVQVSDDSNNVKYMSSYSLKLKNIILDDSLIEGIVSTVPKSVYKTLKTETRNNAITPIFPEDAINGSIGVLYTDEITNNEEPIYIFNASYLASALEEEKLTVGPYNLDKEKRNAQTYCGIYATRWNVTSNASQEDRKLLEWSQNFSGYARAGIATSTNKSAVLSCLKINASGAVGTSFALDFSYKSWNGSGYDRVSANAIRNPITIKIFKGALNGTGDNAPKLISTGSFTMPSLGYKDKTPYLASVQMTLISDLQQNDECWVIFYSTLSNSLIYINPETVKIGESSSVPTVDTHALYVKSSGAWRKIDGSDNAASYVLPVANTNSLGGIKVGNGLSIDNNGVLNVAINNDSIDSDSPWSGEKIAESMEDIMLAVWHDYITPAKARGGTGGKGNGTTNGSGRTIHFYTSNDGLGFTEINRDIYPINRADYENWKNKAIRDYATQQNITQEEAEAALDLSGYQNVGACSIVYWDEKFILTTTGRWRNSNGAIDGSKDGVIGVSKDLINWTWVPFSLGINTGRTGDNVTSVALKCTVIDDKLWCAITAKIPVDSSVENIVWQKLYTFNKQEYEVQRSWYAQITTIDEEQGIVNFWPQGMQPLVPGIIDETSTSNYFDNTQYFSNLEQVPFYNRFSTIDPVLFEYNKQIMLLIKNESESRIELYKLYTDSTCTRFGSLENISNQYWCCINNNVFWRGTEAPAIAYFGGKWHIYADNFSSAIMGPRGIYHCSTVDFFTFSDYHRIEARTDYSIHHGGIMTVSAAAAKVALRNIPDYTTNGIAFIPKEQSFMLKRIESRIVKDNILTIKNLEVVPDTDYYVTAPENGDIGYNTISIENLINNTGTKHVRFIWTTTAVTLKIKNSVYEKTLLEEAEGYVGIPLAINFSDVPTSLNNGGRYVREFDTFLPRDMLTYMMNAGTNGSKLDMRLRPRLTAGSNNSNNNSNSSSGNGNTKEFIHTEIKITPSNMENNLYNWNITTRAGVWYIVAHTLNSGRNNNTSVYTIRMNISNGAVSWYSLTPISLGSDDSAPRLSSNGVLGLNGYTISDNGVDMRIMAILLRGNGSVTNPPVSLSDIANDTLTKEIRALSEANSFQLPNTTFKRCFTMGVISDLHDATTMWKNFATAVNKNKSYVDLALCLGDTLQRPKTVTGEPIENFALSDDIDTAYMYVVGNHDVGYVDSGCIETYDVYNKYINGIHDIIVSNNNPYYYRDFENYNIRIICLYEFEATSRTDPSNHGTENWRWHRYMTETQLNWFIDVLKNTPADYGVIVALHQPVWSLPAYAEDSFIVPPIIDSDSSFTVNGWYPGQFGDYPLRTSHNIASGRFHDVVNEPNFNVGNTIKEHGGNYIGDIIHAFINNEKFCKQYTMKTGNNRDLSGVTIKADFSSSNFKSKNTYFICYLGGHSHSSYVIHLGDYPEQLQIIVPSGSNASGQRRWDDIRPDGTDNYYYISVNTDRKVIKLLKVGNRITSDCRERKITEISYDTTNGGT